MSCDVQLRCLRWHARMHRNQCERAHWVFAACCCLSLAHLQLRRTAIDDLIEYAVQTDQDPTPCKKCHGGRKVECEFCHGTCVMQVGDTLYCSDTGCQVCPVCKGEVLPRLVQNACQCGFACSSAKDLHVHVQRTSLPQYTATRQVHQPSCAEIGCAKQNAHRPASFAKTCVCAGRSRMPSMSRQWLQGMVARVPR